MAEYLAVAEQNILLNQAAVLTASIPCKKGNVFFENETGILILRGNTTGCFARYEVDFQANIALPEGGTPGPIALAIAVNGEARQSSLAISTPAAAEEYTTPTAGPRPGKTSTATWTATPAPVITAKNINVRVIRKA